MSVTNVTREELWAKQHLSCKNMDYAVAALAEFMRHRAYESYSASVSFKFKVLCRAAADLFIYYFRGAISLFQCSNNFILTISVKSRSNPSR